MKNRDGLPPVPSQAFSHLGPLPVAVKPLGEEILGLTRFSPRDISLSPDLGSVTAWQTYWHECVHVALWDSGMKLGPEREEAVCDVIGTYLTAAMRAGFLKVTP